MKWNGMGGFWNIAGKLALMAGMAIGVSVLGWWFYMPNPMAKDRKDRNKKP